MNLPPKVLVLTWLQLATDNSDDFTTSELKASRQRATNFLITYFGSVELAQLYLEQIDVAVNYDTASMQQVSHSVKGHQRLAQELA